MSCSNHLSPSKAIYKLGPNPYYEIDGKPVEFNYLITINADDIAILTTFYDKEANKLYGEKAKDGAVIITTRAYAKNRFETFFSSTSSEYKELLNKADTSEIQYILNNRILKNDYEGNLALVTNVNLKSIKIIGDQELSQKYHVLNKKYGIIIYAKRPKDLYNSKKKF